MNKKQFDIISIVGILLLIGILLIPQIKMGFHGLTQLIFGGYSLSKSIAILLWIIITPLISRVIITKKFDEKLKKYKKIFLSIFLLSIIIGFSLGVVQFNLFSQKFGNAKVLSAITITPEYTNWESTRLEHNHLPKLTVHFVQKLLNLPPMQGFDNGQPLYEATLNPEIWGITYLIIIISAFVSGLAFLNSQTKKISTLSYFVFSILIIHSIVKIIDGGIFTGEAEFTILLFGIFVAENYPYKIHPFIQSLTPLAFVAIFKYLTPVLINLPLSIYPTLLTILISIIYHLYIMLKEKEISFTKHNPITYILVIYLLFSIPSTVSLVKNGIMGREIVEPLEKWSYREDGAGLFIYGIPSDTKLEKLNELILPYGKILELKKLNWLTYARIKPERLVHSKEIELSLQNTLNSKTYLYVEEVAPISAQNTYYIYWENVSNPEKFIREKFLDIKVVKIEKISDNKVKLIAEGKTYVTWQMLTILTEIKENNYNGKLVITQG